MKIGMVSEFYYPHRGGVSEHVRSLSIQLQRRGHEVTVITGGMREGPMEPGPPVIRLGHSVPLRYNESLSRVTLGPRLGRSVRETLHAERFDVVHVHNPLMPGLAHHALRHAACPIVATMHSGYPRDRWSEMFRAPLRRLLQRATILLPVSGAARRTAERVFPGNYRVIPNGVDFEFFSSARPSVEDLVAAPRREPATEAAGSPGGIGPRSGRSGSAHRRILFVGAAVPRKGLPVMLEAYGFLRSRHENLELWVAGDGPDLPRARRAVPEHLQGEVHFLGSCDRQTLRGCYALADIFCAPSLGRESFGLVLLEAMAAGVPVIASDIDGYAEVVDPGVDGLLVTPGDPVAVAGAMDYLLGDPALHDRLVRAGRRKAAGLRWERVAGAVEAAYREACGLRGAVETPSPSVLEPAPSLSARDSARKGPLLTNSD
jgi:phosphatidylinositol alpha-mannosyltransferase